MKSLLGYPVTEDSHIPGDDGPLNVKMGDLGAYVGANSIPVPRDRIDAFLALYFSGQVLRVSVEGNYVQVINSDGLTALSWGSATD